MDLSVKRSYPWLCTRSRRRTLHNKAAKNVHLHENTSGTRKIYVIRFLPLSWLVSFCFYFPSHQVSLKSEIIQPELLNLAKQISIPRYLKVIMQSWFFIFQVHVSSHGFCCERSSCDVRVSKRRHYIRKLEIDQRYSANLYTFKCLHIHFI